MVQNITTDSIAHLSEARKATNCRSLLRTNSSPSSKQDQGRAVFGNVGSLTVFESGGRCGILEKQFVPTFTAQDIMNIDNRNAYVKLLVSGRT